jgi:hypothetical protein
MTYIYESPDKGKTVYRREFGNYKKKEKIMQMLSLYDYLGHAAGPELGRQVAYAAAKAGIKSEMKEVLNPKYKGNVMLYPKGFLDLYFKNNITEGTSGKQLLKG